MNNGLEHYGPVLDKKDGYSVIDCVKCGFKHLDPIPSNEILDEFYKEQYFTTVKPGYIEAETSEAEHMRIAFTERLSAYGRMSSGRDLLDIGCGAGAFLSEAMACGWQVMGVEPSATAVETAKQKNIPVFYGTLDDFCSSAGQKYDVVQLKNVLEHVPDPVNTIEQCRALLKNSGILYIEVPNDYEPIQKIGVWRVKERNSWVSVPDHINYFNFKSLRELLIRKGFKVLAKDTTFPMYIFLWFGRNFIADPAAGKRAHRLRMQMELWLDRHGLKIVKQLLYKALARVGTGRTVIIYSQKA